MYKKLIKITSLVLVLSLMVGLTATLLACKKGNNDDEDADDEGIVAPINIGIVADLQVIADSLQKDIGNEMYANYIQHTSSLKMLELTEAILKTSVDKMLEAEVDVAFFIGDLTENNTRESMNAVAAQCARLEAAGIPVFVASGLIDCCKFETKYSYISADVATANTYELVEDEEFKHIFAEYGYNEAIKQDPNSLSYMADIPGTNYRVLVLENNNDDLEDCVMPDDATAKPLSDAQYAWIESALGDSQRCEKPTFVVSSIPINPNPVSYYTAFMDGTYLTMDRGEDLTKMFAYYGVKYVFSGHTHIGATNVTETTYGTVTEVTTTCLCTYPCQFNIASIDKGYGLTLNATQLDALNGDYIPQAVGDSVKNSCTTNFTTYSKNRYRADFIAARQTKINKGYVEEVTPNENANYGELLILLLEKLHIYPTESAIDNAKLTSLSRDLLNWMAEVNAMPIYGGAGTVQSICTAFGKAVPNSNYTNCSVLDFVMDMIYRMQEGTYIYEKNGTDAQVLTCVLYAGLYKFADIDLFTRISEVNNLVRATDMHSLVENFIATGTADLTQNDFILSVLSLYYQYVQDELPGLYGDIQFASSSDLLNDFDSVMWLFIIGLPDLKLFINEQKKLETSYISISQGKVYGNALISDVLIPVIMRTALYN